MNMVDTGFSDLTLSRLDQYMLQPRRAADWTLNIKSIF